jgi:flagellar protein FliO/FliZ
VAIFQPQLKGERKLNINETRMLGNRQFLVVAQYEDRKVLLGVCPGRIEYLCTLAGGESDFPKLAPEGGDA